MITCMHMYYAGIHNNLVYIRISIGVPCPTHNGFLVLEGLFLKLPRAVLFHATTIHSHYRIDIESDSFFVLERELLICPQFKVTFSQKRLRNGRAS